MIVVPNTVAAPSKNKLKRAWQKVKIKGNVVSDDGGGLEGLIGLEVLEKYDKKLVTKERKTKKQLWKERQEAKKLQEQLSKNSDSDKDDADDDKPPKKKKSKKTKQAKSLSTTSSSSATSDEPVVGRFLLLKPPLESSQNKKKKTSKKLKKEKQKGDENSKSNKLKISELEGWLNFGIPNPILRAIAENGFKSPTEIQSLTLEPAIIGKKDILGAAETGSGKTLAFGIPLLAGILELKQRNVTSGIRKSTTKNENVDSKESQRSYERENFTPPPEELEDYPEIVEDKDDESDEQEDNRPLYALILTPTRELAVQVKDHIVSVAKYTGIKVAAIFGGLAAVKQERILKKCPEIVVATPGRLWELINEGNSHLNKIDNISFLVIDETDRMVEKGHFEELKLLLKRINQDERKMNSRQNFVFSATLTLVHDLPDYLQQKNIGRKLKLLKPTPGMKIQGLIEELGISQPKIVDITQSSQTAQTLTESRIICPIDHKDYYLYYFVQRHPGRTIVFCNSIDCVKRLSQLFGLLNCQPLPLHANMIQKQRLKNLERFRSNPIGLLIATDVAARGLDIPDVQHVIHYQVPRTSENYVHRSGRTARANKDGITVIIMEPGEVKNYLKLCKTLDRSKDLPLFPVSEKHLKSVKERVNLAREVDKLELKIKRIQSEKGWMKKNAEEMDMIIDNDDDDDESGRYSDDGNVEQIEKRKDRNLLAVRRQQLKSILSRPLFPKGLSLKYPTSTGKLLDISFAESEGTEGGNSAVKVMKEAIEEYKLARKRKNKKK